MNIVFAVGIVVYLLLILVAYFLRKRILKRLGTAFLSQGCRLEIGSIFNPINFHVKIIYKDKEFLLLEIQAHDKPFSADIVYKGEIRLRLQNASFWSFPNKTKALLENTSNFEHYYLVGNYLARRITPDDFEHLQEKATGLLDEVQQKASLIEKSR